MRNSEGYYDPTAGIALARIERNEKRMNIRRGDIFYIEKYGITGSEQESGRPALVVSNNRCNEFSEVIEVVYLTTAPKNDLPTHAAIRSTKRESVALCEQVTSVSKLKVKDFICAASAEEMAQIDIALLISLDLTMGAPEAPSVSQETSKPISMEGELGTAGGIVPIPISELNHVVELERENVKLVAQLEIYKSLYSEMTERAFGRVAHG